MLARQGRFLARPLKFSFLKTRHLSSWISNAILHYVHIWYWIIPYCSILIWQLFQLQEFSRKAFLNFYLKLTSSFLIRMKTSGFVPSMRTSPTRRCRVQVTRRSWSTWSRRCHTSRRSSWSRRKRSWTKLLRGWSSFRTIYRLKTLETDCPDFLIVQNHLGQLFIDKIIHQFLLSD